MLGWYRVGCSRLVQIPLHLDIGTVVLSEEFYKSFAAGSLASWLPPFILRPGERKPIKDPIDIWPELLMRTVPRAPLDSNLTAPQASYSPFLTYWNFYSLIKAFTTPLALIIFPITNALSSY